MNVIIRTLYDNTHLRCFGVSGREPSIRFHKKVGLILAHNKY